MVVLGVDTTPVGTASPLAQPVLKLIEEVEEVAKEVVVVEFTGEGV